MRDIEFRGKRIDNGEWAYGFFVFDEFKGFEGRAGIAFTDSPLGFEVVEVDIKTVGQYTGLTDKNGTKVFEGDIVAGFFDGKKIIGIITYSSNAEFFIERKGLYGIFLNNSEDWVEVIGNIHDNPELLKGGAE